MTCLRSPPCISPEAAVSAQGIGRGAAATAPMSALLNALGHGAGGNEYTTYAASASYVASSPPHAFALENSEPSLFDYASDGRGCRRTLFSGGRFGTADARTLSVTA